MDTKSKSKSIVFLDDCKVFNDILKNGYLNKHPINQHNLKVLSSPIDLFEIVKEEPIDLLVVDYHLNGSDGLEVVEIAKHYQPECTFWLFTGMVEDYIHDSRKEMIQRYIHKDAGVVYLLDQLIEADF